MQKPKIKYPINLFALKQEMQNYIDFIEENYNEVHDNIFREIIFENLFEIFYGQNTLTEWIAHNNKKI